MEIHNIRFIEKTSSQGEFARDILFFMLLITAIIFLPDKA